MLLLDVNVLVYAHNSNAERHLEYRSWLQHLLAGPEPYAVSDFVLNGLVAIITDKRLFQPATPIDVALAFADQVRHQAHAHVIAPGGRFWAIFDDLCRKTSATAKLIPDAYLAALAIEHGCEFVTLDSDFKRFPGLRSRHPLLG
ncbi:MAG TPA: type II toxin-antitoxin system VapC family toxin [Trebonia sp.]